MLRITLVVGALAAVAALGAASHRPMGTPLTADEASAFWGSACGGTGYGKQCRIAIICLRS
jgi:hypothetical protein